MTEDDDDRFSRAVHGVAVQLNDWIMIERPNIDHLMPALAVVLGRLIARRAQDHAELATMLNLAGNAATNAAEEDWESRADVAHPCN